MKTIAEQSDDWWIIVKADDDVSDPADSELKTAFYSGAYALLNEIMNAADLDFEAAAVFHSQLNEMTEYFESLIADEAPPPIPNQAPLH